MDNNALFKILVKSYIDNNFEDTVDNLLNKDDANKDELSKIISSLCGVEGSYTKNNFSRELKKAISNYTANNKVVIKVKNCCMNCTSSDTKTLCQSSCPFDAIVIDESKHTTLIDSAKCTDCGFCIEACPNGNYIDKIEYLPLLSSI
ncbi:4Fe-4S binding domain protein [Clostridiales bacterium oral taxon 876 str. F0540]|nr:4Fe-4S binding domain protein [Clostridiales bacterium oral taxon 876 str. F0540]